MTTIKEEDELFGASLYMDFYPSSSPAAGNHPWQPSSSPRSPAQTGAPSDNTRSNSSSNNSSNRTIEKNDRHREPYELLDDVPPATGISNNIGRAHQSERTTPSATPATAASRYPVEELYPTVRLPFSLALRALPPPRSRVETRSLSHRRRRVPLVVARRRFALLSSFLAPLREREKRRK